MCAVLAAVVAFCSAGIGVVAASPRVLPCALGRALLVREDVCVLSCACCGRAGEVRLCWVWCRWVCSSSSVQYVAPVAGSRGAALCLSHGLACSLVQQCSRPLWGVVSCLGGECVGWFAPSDVMSLPVAPCGDEMLCLPSVRVCAARVIG